MSSTARLPRSCWPLCPSNTGDLAYWAGELANTRPCAIAGGVVRFACRCSAASTPSRHECRAQECAICALYAAVPSMRRAAALHTDRRNDMRRRTYRTIHKMRGFVVV